MKILSKLKFMSGSTILLALTSTSAMAQDVDGWWRRWRDGRRGNGGGGGDYNAVPEIDAGAGLLAIAAVLATLALVYELRRRHRAKNAD